MFLKILAPALLLAAPSMALASANAYEAVRAPAGKTVMGWRQVQPQQTATITCHPDSTKAFGCNARKAELLAQAEAARSTRLSER